MVQTLTVQPSDAHDADNDGNSDITFVPLCLQQSVSFFALNFHDKFFSQVFNVAFVCFLQESRNFDNLTIEGICVASYFWNQVRFHPSGIPVAPAYRHMPRNASDFKRKAVSRSRDKLKRILASQLSLLLIQKWMLKHLSLLFRGPKGHGESAGSKMGSLMDPRFSRLYSLLVAEI